MAVRFVKQFSGCQPVHCELLKIKIFSVPNGTLKTVKGLLGALVRHTSQLIKNHNAQKYAVYSRFAGTTYYPLQIPSRSP